MPFDVSQEMSLLYWVKISLFIFSQYSLSLCLASSTITPIDQLHYLQQLEALDAQKASLISYLLTNQFDQVD